MFDRGEQQVPPSAGPTGAVITPQQWEALARGVVRRGLDPNSSEVPERELRTWFIALDRFCEARGGS